MNELPSTEFRKTFARISEPTVVTANGHVIGQWVPTAWVGVTQADVTDASHPSRRPVQTNTPLTAQSQRDALLGKINKR